MPSLSSPSEPAISTRKLRLEDIVAACGGFAILVVIATGLAQSRPAIGNRQDIDSMMAHHVSMLSYGLFFGTLIIVYLWQPVLAFAVSAISKFWRPAFSAVAIAAISLFVAIFIIHEGRHQFGGWDFGILIGSGWRQLQGQHLYSDFIDPVPPGFSLGVKYAFELFGISWNANLYFSALFAIATMLWLYWLMRKLDLSRFASLGIAFAIEASTMMLLSFWWYNDTALVMASVFLLASLAYAHHQAEPSAQVSYIGALAVFVLMKPNVAGIAIVGSVLLMLIACDHRAKLILLTLCGLSISLLVLVCNHVSIPALLSSYHEANKNRGGLSSFGLDQMGPVDRYLAIGVTGALAVTWLSVVPQIFRAVRSRHYAEVALGLFLPLAYLTSLYAVRTNGEFWFVELPPLFAIGACLNYDGVRKAKLISRFFTSLVCACVMVSLYLGAIRFRVSTIGPQQFFEWADNQNRISEGFLNDMRVGAPMIEMQRQIGSAVKENAGPYFLGPRIDFNYAVLRLRSPEGLPAWWQPGVSFSPERVHELLQVWQDHHFETLIFLKGDYTFYPRRFLNILSRDYIRDDRYSRITVYHRRTSIAPQHGPVVPKPH